MIVHRIRAKYIRTHTDTEIRLEPGVTGLIGANETGKSTLIEVLGYLIYGARAIRKTLGGFRSTRAPETRKAEADGDIESHGKVYHIERSEKGATVKVDGQIVAEGQDGVSDYMAGVLGRTLEEFQVSPLCMQKDVERIASMTPAARQGFIRRLLGVGRIDDGLKALRKRKNELQKERDGLAAGLGEREPLQDDVDRASQQVKTTAATLERMGVEVHETGAALQDAQTALKVSDGVRGRHASLTAAITDAEREATRAHEAIQRLVHKRESAEEAAKRVESATQDLERLPALRKERDELRDARAAQDERKSLESRLATLREELDGDAGLRARLEDAQAQVDFYDADAYEAAQEKAGEAEAAYLALRDVRQNELAAARAELEAAGAQRDRAAASAEKIKAMGADSPCPTCTRPLGDSLDVVLDALRQAIRKHQHQARTLADLVADLADNPSDEELAAEAARDAAEKEVERLHQLRQDAELGARQVQDLASRIEAAEKEIAALEARSAELPAVEFDADRLREIEGEVRDLDVLDSSLASDRGLAAQIDDISAELNVERENHAQATDAVGRITADRAELHFDPAGHEELVAAAEKAERAHNDARLAQARADEVHAGANLVAKKAQAALAEYDQRAERLTEIDDTLALHRKTDARLADFRVAIIDQIRPEMEELVSGFIHVLTDGRHEAVTLTEDFQCILHESGVQHEVVSGGTENVAALAMRLAISQMIAERSGDPEDMLVLDEPFDGIDETRRQNVLNLIRRLRGIYRQVVVVSHLPDTREAVDHVIELEYDEATGSTSVVSSATLEEAA